MGVLHRALTEAGPAERGDVRRATLSERIRSFPTPVAGLALGIASLGLAWENVLPGTRIAESTAVVAAVLLTLLTVRFILHPSTLSRDLANPVVGGVAPTFAMGWMLVSLSVWEVSHLGWALLWLCALGVHMVFLSVFARHQWAEFTLARMVPSWFVPPVGVICRWSMTPNRCPLSC